MSIILVSFTLRIWCTDKLNGCHANKYLRITKKYFLLYSLDNNTRSLHKTLEVSYVEVSNVKLPCQRSSRLNVGVINKLWLDRMWKISNILNEWEKKNVRWHNLNCCAGWNDNMATSEKKRKKRNCYQKKCSKMEFTWRFWLQSWRGK